MKKLTWKGLVLSLIPMLAAFVVCFAALYSGSLTFFHFAAFEDMNGRDITKYVFLFLFLLCAIVLAVWSVISLLFGEKVGPFANSVTLIGVLVIAFALFLTNFIVIVINMVDFFKYSDYFSGWYITTYVFTQLLYMVAWLLPLVLGALLTVVYFILLKKLPKNALINKMQDFVESKVPVEAESGSTEEVAPENN